MKKDIIDLLDEAVKNIPGELHRKGKNLIGYEPLFIKRALLYYLPRQKSVFD